MWQFLLRESSVVEGASGAEADTTDRIPGPTHVAPLDTESGLSDNDWSSKLKCVTRGVQIRRCTVNEIEFQTGTVIADGLQ